jgi:hypothetical protein
MPVAPGTVTNAAEATGYVRTAGADLTVTATDIAIVLVTAPGISVTKAVNGQAADTPGTALFVNPGTSVTWTYVVRAASGVSISGVSLIDDHGTFADTADDFAPTFTGGDANGNGRLDPGETWTYTATGTIPAGAYGNVAPRPGHRRRRDRARRRPRLRLRIRSGGSRSRRPSTP